MSMEPALLDLHRYRLARSDFLNSCHEVLNGHHQMATRFQPLRDDLRFGSATGHYGLGSGKLPRSSVPMAWETLKIELARLLCTFVKA